MKEVACTVPSSGNADRDPCWQMSLSESSDWRNLSALNQSIWHPVYQCEIYCWLATGSIILDRSCIKKQYFLYCEYRDRTAASQYVVYSFSSLSEALTFQQTFVAQQVLPDISPDQTHKRPILKK